MPKKIKIARPVVDIENSAQQALAGEVNSQANDQAAAAESGSSRGSVPAPKKRRDAKSGSFSSRFSTT